MPSFLTTLSKPFVVRKYLFPSLPLQTPKEVLFIWSFQFWCNLFHHFTQPAHVHTRLQHSYSQMTWQLKMVTAGVFSWFYFLFFHPLVSFSNAFFIPQGGGSQHSPAPKLVPSIWGSDKLFLWWWLQGMKSANAMQITLMKQPNVLGLRP